MIASPSLGQRAMWFLLEDWDRPDSVIAKLAECSLVRVGYAREHLESTGEISHRPQQLSEDAYRPRTAADLCRAALLDDSTRSNAEIASAEGVDTAQVADVRRRLEGLGVLAPQRVPAARFPQHVPMPRAPRSLMQGACVGHPGGWWVSDDLADRQAARQVCTGCQVLADCLDWALRAIPGDDTTIYAGTGPAQRRRLRAKRGITRPNGTQAINAAKVICPECGEALSGENLITEPGRRPGTVRRRCRACTQLRKREDYQRRKQAGAGCQRST
jgi:hypothetical protein